MLAVPFLAVYGAVFMEIGAGIGDGHQHAQARGQRLCVLHGAPSEPLLPDLPRRVSMGWPLVSLQRFDCANTQEMAFRVQIQGHIAGPPGVRRGSVWTPRHSVLFAANFGVVELSEADIPDEGRGGLG